jgi:hypothetical protein
MSTIKWILKKARSIEIENISTFTTSTNNTCLVLLVQRANLPVSML